MRIRVTESYSCDNGVSDESGSESCEGDRTTNILTTIIQKGCLFATKLSLVSTPMKEFSFSNVLTKDGSLNKEQNISKYYDSQ
ncbi:Hypothetical predicted protein [Octopus vulgaris]|uniref:Uncharacterized protein n=1 Tax=Octopus vulgaris TaxID=6645 RepID=A0AA36B418_OCTVU|nr:Hypothetical predicted protein [Octopus vulgaris]